MPQIVLRHLGIAHATYALTHCLACDHIELESESESRRLF